MGRVTRKMSEQLILPTKDFLNYHTGKDAAIAWARKIIDANLKISEPFLTLRLSGFKILNDPTLILQNWPGQTSFIILISLLKTYLNSRIFFLKIRYYDFCKNNILIINLIVI